MQHAVTISIYTSLLLTLGWQISFPQLTRGYPSSVFCKFFEEEILAGDVCREIKDPWEVGQCKGHESILPSPGGLAAATQGQTGLVLTLTHGLTSQPGLSPSLSTWRYLVLWCGGCPPPQACPAPWLEAVGWILLCQPKESPQLLVPRQLPAHTLAYCSWALTSSLLQKRPLGISIPQSHTLKSAFPSGSESRCPILPQDNSSTFLSHSTERFNNEVLRQHYKGAPWL